MVLRRTFIPAALVAALCALPPAAMADTALPDSLTHVDPAGSVDPDSPQLTLKADTDAADVRRGYLYVLARCDARCVVDFTAKVKISGKKRVVATATKTLPARRTVRVRMKIRSDIRRRVAAGARFYFEGRPFPPDDA